MPRSKDFQTKYRETYREYKSNPGNERSAEKLKEATLERAERREWAHKRRGDEGRFNE